MVKANSNKNAIKKRITEIIAPEYRKLWNRIKKSTNCKNFEDFASSFSSIPSVKDPAKRARFDLYWNIPREIRNSDEMFELTKNITDNELDTILRKIVKTL